MRVLDIASRIIIGILYIPALLLAFSAGAALFVGVFYGLFLIGEKLF